MDKPFVSLIVPVRNAARTIDKTFEYILQLSYPKERMEIILADGGSRDETVEIIKKYQANYPYIKLIEIPNCPSPGYARTQALQKAEGDFVFFTDGDCAPVEDWIEKMLAVFAQDERIGAVGGEIYTLRVEKENLVEIYCEAFGFNRVSWRYGNLEEGYYPDYKTNYPTEICGHQAYFFVTANVSYRKAAIEDAERKFWPLPTGEDIDFGLRVRKKGWKFYFLPQAFVKHMHRANLKSLLKVWRSYAQAHPPLLAAHASKHLEIILQFIGRWPKHPVLRMPFFIKGFIYIGDFHLMHLFLLLSILGFWVRGWFLIASGILFLFFLFRFFRSAFNIEPYNRWFAFARMKYLTNLYFFLGGMSGSFKYKTFCIEPSF